MFTKKVGVGGVVGGGVPVARPQTSCGYQLRSDSLIASTPLIGGSIIIVREGLSV